MIRLLCLGLVLTALSTPAQVRAQGLKDGFFLDSKLHDSQYPTHPIPFGIGGFATKPIDTSFKVTHYDIFLDLDKPLRAKSESERVNGVNGTVSLEAVVLKNKLDVVRLNAVQMSIRSIRILLFDTDITSECRVEIVDNSFFEISRPNGFTRADVLKIDIDYTIESTFYGLHVYSYLDAQKISLPHPIAFTFSQPNNARYWYPSLDLPYNKATYIFSVQVPKEFTVVCSGKPLLQDAINDSVSFEQWYLDVPTPSYLTSINASIYVNDNQTAYSIDGDTIPILNYHWEIDRADTLFNALNALNNIPNMFTALEETFGAYPYDSYGHVTISPIQFGGMEHMMMCSINREWLKGRVEFGYAHELAHHWSGNAVTCATWADLWLNEGGASWAEAVWRRSTEGLFGYNSQMFRRRDSYMKKASTEPAIYDIDFSILFKRSHYVFQSCMGISHGFEIGWR